MSRVTLFYQKWRHQLILPVPPSLNAQVNYKSNCESSRNDTDDTDRTSDNILRLQSSAAVFFVQTFSKMDLSKMPNEKKLYLCKWYFRGGFAMLPFLWAVNAVWFAQEAFSAPHFDEQKQIRRYVIFSGLGALLWSGALLAWIITFQTQRAAWGEFGDSISYIIPTGIP